MIGKAAQLGLSAALIAGVAFAPDRIAAQGSISRQDNVRVPMSDGASLATDLYLPDADGKFPVVLVRTPYSRRQLVSYIAEPLAEQGYAVVMQDVRGMGDSDGQFVPFVHEKTDGLDALQWIAQQPWCDGNVGMWGASYSGYCALIVAPEQHPALKAVFNISGWGNTYEMVSPGGALHLMMGLPWTLSGQIRGQGSLGDIDWPTAFRHVPIVQIPSALGIASPQWEAAVGLYTGDYLVQTAGIADRYDRIRTPVLHLTGWYDMIARHTLDVYEGIDHATGAKSRPFQKLIVGPWRHDQQWGDGTLVGDEDFGPASVMGMQKVVALTVRWFNHWLKGINNGIAEEAPVKLFVMGPNEWRSYKAWPPRGTKKQKWYIGSTRGANSLEGDGTLFTSAPERDGRDTFVFDPMAPVPTLGGANCHFFRKTLGIRDQRPAEKRQDVLVYTSAPLKRPLTIIGPLRAVIYAATDGRHTDFTAKLVEVRQDGYARVIDDGIKRGPDSAPVGRIEPIEPGKVYRYTVDLGKTAITVPQGNRLCVEVSSSNFPKYTRNPNTGEPPEHATVFTKVKQTVLHSRKHPSHVVLPVLD